MKGTDLPGTLQAPNIISASVLEMLGVLVLPPIIDTAALPLPIGLGRRSACNKRFSGLAACQRARPRRKLDEELLGSRIRNETTYLRLCPIFETRS